MKLLFTFLIIGLFFFNCKKNKKEGINISKEIGIKCSNKGCLGTYNGPEFINGSDIAHQFSNKMSHKVGDKLKELYKNGIFKKVNFDKIKMTTKGMGTGEVKFTLIIPFVSVKNKCEAFTSFDHVGGWNPYTCSSKKEKRVK